MTSHERMREHAFVSPGEFHAEDVSDCHDELLQSLHVISVVPAPNSSRLLVTVSADLPIETFDRQEILELLERQTGRLRAEVAASINRKRVPSLVFHVIGPAVQIHRSD